MWIIAQYSTFTKVIDTDYFACINIEQTEDGGAIFFENKKGELIYSIPIICSKEDFEHIKGNITMSLGSDVTFIIPPEFLVH